MSGLNIRAWVLMMFLLLLGETGFAQSWQKLDFDLKSLESEQFRSALLPYLPELRNTSLTIKNNSKSPSGWHVYLKQVFQSRELYQSELIVHLDHELHAYGMSATVYPLLNSSVNLSRQDLGSLIYELAEEADADELSDQEIWWLEGNNWVPAHSLRMFFNQGELAAEELIISSTDQRIIQREDLGTYFRHQHASQTKLDTSGRARVFFPDPCTRGQLRYGIEFEDGKDTHTLQFESLMDTVELQGLSYSTDDSLFRLEGPYVKVVDRAAFFYPISVSTDGDFFFTRDQSGFEDVMAYYHIDRFRRYVEDLGFHDLLNKPIEVDPHGLGNNDQSTFVGNSGNSYILFGDGGVDDAEDADVIIHEYIHALSYDATPESNRGFERKGIDEGFADYFTAAYSYDISSWNWFELFNWDGHNEFWEGRMAVTLESYPPINGFGSIYEVGTLWASTLMNIRFDLGPEITDALALECLYFLRRDMSLPNVAEALLMADTVLFEGIYTPVIRDRLCQRNLFSSPFCIAVAQETASNSLAGNKFQIAPNPVSNVLELSWEGNKNLEISLENLYGKRVIEKKIIKLSNIKLHIPSNISPGYYLLKVRDDSGNFLVHKLNIVAH
ncbi:MAG: T9SS type A sorting domain-containing protein [Bacteroidia bacterium]|nr:T9SS type A sorting domain-containing protein [Bacteroidia bacterium]